MNNNCDYNFIKHKQKRGEPINMYILSKAIYEEVKFKKNFQNAEELFQELDKKRSTIREGSQHFTNNIYAYQRSISSLVRFAPTPEKSQYYTNHFFENVEKPFRTPAQELIVLTNLVYVYGAEGSSSSMEAALKIVEMVIEIGTFKVDQSIYFEGCSNAQKSGPFNDPIQVFESVCYKMLQHYKLQFNADKSKLIKRTSY